MPSIALRIPITNVYGGGDYTAPISVGSQNAVCNVILDTGSSTLAVKTGPYHPESDANLSATPYAQDVTYGTGGWAGPLVITSVSMGAAGNAVNLPNTPLAITDEQQLHNFGAADGILGLAYSALNNAYNFSAYLRQRDIRPAVTFPWPFALANSTGALAQFQQLIQTMSPEDIPPYFSQLESSGIVANKFAFYTLRSAVSFASKNPLQDPQNSGLFILGGGEEQTDLYQGSTFLSVDVLDDAWYNTTLRAVRVDGCPPVRALPLPIRYEQSMISNSIIDSGTNGLVLAGDVLKAILVSLEKINPLLIRLVEQQIVSTSQLDLGRWPNIHFILAGEDGQDVTLTCTPRNYWQLDAPKKGQATFQICDGGMPQSILGLPLMNNYYTVFDRSQDAYGVIQFAPIRRSP